MADRLELQPDEAIVRRNDGVGMRSNMFGTDKRHTLILTNKAILLEKKDVFGKTKEVLRFPLSEIRVAEGKVQAVMGQADFVTPSLDVYFTSGPQRFLFTWEKDVKEWIDDIGAVVRGEPIKEKNEYEDLMKDMAEMAAFAEGISGSVAGSINKVKDALGIKSTEKVAMTCPSCGASLAGIRGETDKCPYCGSYVKF